VLENGSSYAVRRRCHQGPTHVVAVVYYVALMITGDIIAYFIGLVIERNAPSASLPAFLAMYFGFLWLAGHRGPNHGAEDQDGSVGR
jgi:CDP-diglyceride synthetase